MAVISVVGMHKSGTTLAAQILNASGVPMITGLDQRSYDAGNKCERLATNLLNKELLSCGSQNSLKVLHRYEPSKSHSALQERARDIIAKENIECNYQWGFKDPRSCLTHMFWSELIPGIKVVCIYRSASSVRRHYVSKKSSAFADGLRALRAWAIYNSAVIEVFEGTPPDRRILLNFDMLLEKDTEFQRFESFVGIPLKDLRLKELNRSKQGATLVEKIQSFLVKFFWGLDTKAIEWRLQRLIKEDQRRSVEQ